MLPMVLFPGVLPLPAPVFLPSPVANTEGMYAVLLRAKADKAGGLAREISGKLLLKGEFQL